MVLDDARVSWRHATVRWAGQGWIIEDQGSTNGTYVQGQRIHQVEIGPGSVVHLGNATTGPRISLAAAGAPAAGAVGAQQAAAPQQQGWQAPPAQQPPVHQAPQRQAPQQAAAQQGWQAPPQAQQQAPYIPP